MKILMVGSAKPFAIEASYKKYLERWAEVNLFEAHDLFLAHYTKSTLHKLIYRLGYSSILRRINKELIALVTENKPDIVWVFKGMEIYPETLKKIKSLGIILVNYNADDPFDYTFAGSGNENVKNSLPLYNHHFSYSRRIVDRIGIELQLKSSWLPFAYNFSQLLPAEVEHSETVCFIGNPDYERANLLNYLCQNGINIHLYGVDWSKFIQIQENIKIFGSVLNDEFIATSQKYYCQLNVFRPQNRNSHNMRTFEMPALGCVMFAPRSEEHLYFFQENKEAFYYKNREELLDKLITFFKLNEVDKRALSNQAYLRSLKGKYSYEDRARTVLQVFKNLIKVGLNK